MIISSLFADDPTSLASLQHDVYHLALGIIVGALRQHERQAARILNVQLPDQLEQAGIDHRTLQNHHDILAATWRYRVRQATLFGSSATMSEWLNWLQAECDSWNQEPDIVRLGMLIIRNQNVGAGYEAEDDLQRLLFLRFSEVRWLRQLV